MMKPILTILLAGILLHAGGSTEAANLLFDESHDQIVPMSSDGIFTEARSDLLSAGHTISSLSGAPGAITTATLAGYDTFVTGTMQEGFTPEEEEDLWDFVAAGGGVIVTHDGGLSANSATASINSFLTPYGMSLGTLMIESGGVVVSDLADHCLFDGITQLGFDYLRRLDTIEPPAIELQTAAPHLMGLYDSSTGWVMVIGDISQWTDPGTGADYTIADFDNRQLLLNVFGFDNCNESAVTATTWSAIKVLY